MSYWIKDQYNKYRNLSHARNMYVKDCSVIVEFVQQRISLGPSPNVEQFDSEEEAQAYCDHMVGYLNQPPKVSAILDPDSTMVLVAGVMNQIAAMKGDGEKQPKKTRTVRVKKDEAEKPTTKPDGPQGTETPQNAGKGA